MKNVVNRGRVPVWAKRRSGISWSGRGSTPPHQNVHETKTWLLPQGDKGASVARKPGCADAARRLVE